MVVSRRNFCLLVTYLILFLSSSPPSSAEYIDYPSVANLSTSWLNDPSSDFTYWESAGVRPILISGSFVCGFHCKFEGDDCLFAVSIFQTGSDRINSNFALQMVWSANRNNPVEVRATLQLTQDGDLLLQDADGILVWSTATAAKSVSGLKLTEEGNLVLVGRNDTLIWQSFDYPTDSLLPGQRLVSGQKLIASFSASNWSKGQYSFGFENDRLVAYMDFDPPQKYMSIKEITNEKGKYYAEYVKGRFSSFILNSTSSAQFIQFGSDGHLRAYEWRGSIWKEFSDLLTDHIGKCGYPLACGRYGICSNEQCTCPQAVGSETTYFKQIDYTQPDLGCSENQPISCEFSHYHSFLEFNQLEYLASGLGTSVNATDEDNCKQACLKICSCKAAIFEQEFNVSTGQRLTGFCSLLSKVISFRNISATEWWSGMYYNTDRTNSVFIKVQNFPNVQGPSLVTSSEKKSGFVISPEKKSRHLVTILGSTLGSAFGLFFMITTIFILRNKMYPENTEEEYLEIVSEMPGRFSYKELKAITENFSIKLGEGGFGSVFEGTLPNGAKVAVKCLNGFGQVKKSFLAEVLTIGSIHHVNLVRLIGFCAEKFNRLLVYEYMCNGSLDQWVFHRNQELSLGWQSRRKIILDIAKGLAYLHDDCRQKIFHLDIKPQNILLDENFNAKVSDFGLSKLIDREQSQVVTTMRGTPGYMAPEWLSSIITEKVDVYSFGVVVMEILCGRKNVDRCQPEEDMHLLSLFKRKAEEGQLFDLIDKQSDDMLLNGIEVMEMMKIAVWCLQGDYAKRPSMSVVVKVLESSLDVEENLEYVFSGLPEPRGLRIPGDRETVDTLAIPSILSGPR